MSCANLLDNNKNFIGKDGSVLLKDLQVEVIKPVLFPINTKIGIQGDLEMTDNATLDFQGEIQISSNGNHLITSDASDNIVMNDLVVNGTLFHNGNFVPPVGGDYDASINLLEQQVNILDISVNGLEQQVNILDISVNGLEQQVNILDASINLLEQQVDVLDASLNLKYDKSGGNINGSVNISGDLSVSGVINHSGFNPPIGGGGDSELLLHQFQSFPENTAIETDVGSSATLIGFGGGCLAQNGKIYAPALSAGRTNVLIIDPKEEGNISQYYDTTTINNGNGGYRGCVLAKNGKIYCVPFDTNCSTVMIIDPKTNTTDITTITNIFSGVNNEAQKWSGAVLAQNGKIYCVPQHADKVLVIDPETDTTEFITGLTALTNKWDGAVLAPNGKIYCIPKRDTSVLIIDPETNTFDSIANIGSGSNKYVGGVLSQNGKIYCVPFGNTDVLVIDPKNNSTELITGVPSGSNKWTGGVLGQNGLIYCIPFQSQVVLIIDPETNTIDFTTITGITGMPQGFSPNSFKFIGGILSPNGRVYCINNGARNFTRFSVGLPKLPEWMLQAYFNKF